MRRRTAIRKKLDWLVAQQRNGGAWVPVGWEMIDIRMWFGDVFQVPGFCNRLRWVRL